VIANAVGGFLVILAFATATIALLLWPLFWRFLWDYRLLVVSVLIPQAIVQLIQGWFQDFAYDQYYVKRRSLAGFLDTFYFFLAILEGLAQTLKRIYVSVIAVLVS
jgi:hypothetical protein